MAMDGPDGSHPLSKRPSFASLYGNRTMLVLLALGFAGGLPNVMVTKVAQAWTSAAHWDVAAIGALSAWTLPYAFKFAWAPIVDSVQLPLLGRLGRRRSWLLASQVLAMAALLAAIDRGGALTPESRAVLLDTMTRTSTGKNRIRSGLPEGVVFAHKTGTLAGVTDDVGIVRLPDGRHLAMAIFVTGPEGHTAHAGLIAQIARVLYDGYSQSLPLVGLETARR